MPGPAVRLGDMVATGGAFTSPVVASVLIEGRPAANMLTMHVGCPIPPPPAAPHPPVPGGMPGSSTVLIGGQPALRVGVDVAAGPCAAPIVGPGALTVLIGP